MSVFISAYISRILIAGFIVFCAMAASGRGGSAEIMRLACACFMIIIMLSPILGLGLTLTDAASYVKVLEEEISSAVEASRRDAARETVEETERQLEAGLAAMGYGEVTVDCVLSGSDIESITVTGADGQDDRIGPAISGMTGMPMENIYFK